MKRLQQIQERQAVIKTRLAELAAMAEPEGDEIARSAALEARGNEADELCDEWDDLDGEAKPLIERSNRIDTIARAAQTPANRETAFPAAPNVIIKKDPYDNLADIQRGYFKPSEMIERARYAVEQAPGHLDDAGRAHVEKLLTVHDDDEGRQAPGIARHMLMTGSPEYHQQFREFMRTRYPGELLRAAMTLTDANGGRVAVLCG